MKFEPFGNRVLILPDKKLSGEKTVGSLVIPDIGNNPDVTTGIIKAAGPDIITGKGSLDFSVSSVQNYDVNIGDRVLYGAYAGMLVTLGGVDHILLSSGEVMGKLTKDVEAKVA